MPSENQTPVKAYAHCTDSRCPGNTQEPVDAIAVETSYSFQETGGDGMFGHPERSMTRLRFYNDGQEHPGEDEPRPDDGKCESCGGHRDLSETPRLQLDDSGYDRMALLDIEPDLRDPESYKKGSGGHVVIDDERTSALEAENRELREGLAELRGIMLGQQSQPPAPEEPEAEPED